MVYMRRRRLINTETFTLLLVNTVSNQGPPDINKCCLTGDAYRDMLSDFPSIFKLELHHTNPGAIAKYGV